MPAEQAFSITLTRSGRRGAAGPSRGDILPAFDAIAQACDAIASDAMAPALDAVTAVVDTTGSAPATPHALRSSRSRTAPIPHVTTAQRRQRLRQNAASTYGYPRAAPASPTRPPLRASGVARSPGRPGPASCARARRAPGPVAPDRTAAPPRDQGASRTIVHSPSPGPRR